MNMALSSGPWFPEPGVGGVTQHSGGVGWGTDRVGVLPGRNRMLRTQGESGQEGWLEWAAGSRAEGIRVWALGGRPWHQGRCAPAWGGCVSQDRQQLPRKIEEPPHGPAEVEVGPGRVGEERSTGLGSAGLPATPGDSQPHPHRSPGAREAHEQGAHLCEHPRQPLPQNAAALPGPGAPGGRRGCPRWVPTQPMGVGALGATAPRRAFPQVMLGGWCRQTPSPLCRPRPLQRSGLPGVTRACSPGAAFRG